MVRSNGNIKYRIHAGCLTTLSIDSMLSLFALYALIESLFYCSWTLRRVWQPRYFQQYNRLIHNTHNPLPAAILAPPSNPMQMMFDDSPTRSSLHSCSFINSPQTFKMLLIKCRNCLFRIAFCLG